MNFGLPETQAFLFISMRKLHKTVIQLEGITINAFVPVESFIQCIFATQESEPCILWIKPTFPHSSQGCSRRDIKTDGRLFL